MTELKDIIQLFESRHTEQLSDRHAEAISQLCIQYNASESAFYYRQLEELALILSLIHKSLVNGKVLHLHNNILD